MTESTTERMLPPVDEIVDLAQLAEEYPSVADFAMYVANVFSKFFEDQQVVDGWLDGTIGVAFDKEGASLMKRKADEQAPPLPGLYL